MTKKILLVEDDKTTASIFLMELEDAGFDSVLAQDGAQALECLNQQAFDGIISDLYMPNLDGLQLIDAIKAMSLNINTIIISGSVNAETRSLLKEKGVEHVFIKPPTDEQLETIFTLLREG